MNFLLWRSMRNKNFSPKSRFPPKWATTGVSISSEMGDDIFLSTNVHLRNKFFRNFNFQSSFVKWFLRQIRIRLE